MQKGAYHAPANHLYRFYLVETERYRVLGETIDLEFLLTDLPNLLLSMRVGADRIRKIFASLRT